MGAPVVAPLTGHLDVALTNFGKKYRNNALVSDIICPRVPVGRQADKYWIYGKEGQQLTEQTLRASGASPQEVRLALSSDTYKCESHALGASIPDENRLGYEPGTLEQDVTMALADKLLLDKEKRFFDLLTAANLTQNLITLAGGTLWSDPINSDPIGNVEAGKSVIRKNGLEPNYLVIGEEVFTALIKNDSILERFKYTSPGAIGLDQLKAAFAIENVVVARAVIGTAAGVFSMPFGKKATLCYVSPSPTSADLSTFKTFVWLNAPGTVGGYGTVSGRHPDARAKSDLVGVDFYYDQKITAAETAYLIFPAVA